MDKYDERIHWFSYRKVDNYPYQSFMHWVLPPPNPRPVMDDEKREATQRHVRNLLKCECGYPSELETSPLWRDYTPFFHCALVGRNGWRLCDFRKYIYGPTSQWPEGEALEKCS